MLTKNMFECAFDATMHKGKRAAAHSWKNESIEDFRKQKVKNRKQKKAQKSTDLQRSMKAGTKILVESVFNVNLYSVIISRCEDFGQFVILLIKTDYSVIL